MKNSEASINSPQNWGVRGARGSILGSIRRCVYTVAQNWGARGAKTRKLIVLVICVYTVASQKGGRGGWILDYLLG